MTTRKQMHENSANASRRWANEYIMSPVAHPEVVDLLGKFGVGQYRETDRRLMNNVMHYHAQEWFKGDPEGHHEITHNLTKWYLDEHNGNLGAAT